MDLPPCFETSPVYFVFESGPASVFCPLGDVYKNSDFLLGGFYYADMIKTQFKVKLKGIIIIFCI